MNDMTRALDSQHILPEHDEALARLVTFCSRERSVLRL